MFTKTLRTLLAAWLLILLCAGGAAAQSINKTFGAASIALNHTTTLTYTVTAGASDLLNFGFTDPLPSGLVPTLPPSTNTCGLGLASGALSYSGGNVAANMTCQVIFTVTATTEGDKTSFVTGNGDLAGKVKQATLTVVSPTFTKSFSPTTIPLNGHTTLSFQILNGTPDTLTVGWQDPLPNGMRVATPLVLPPTCGGTGTVSVTVGASSDTINVSGGTIATLGTCMMDFDIIARASTAGTGNIAHGAQDLLTLDPVASIIVKAPTFTKSFSDSVIPLYGMTTMTLHIVNNTGSPLTNVGFSDPIPAGLDAVSLTSASCSDSTTLPVVVTSAAFPINALVSLTGGSIANGVTCDVKVLIKAVISPMNAPLVNQLGGILTSDNIVNGTGDLTSLDRLASIDVKYPGFSKTASPAVFRTDTGMTTFTITVNNNTGFPFADLRFSDTLPPGLTLVAGSVTNGCPGVETDTANGFSIGAFSLAPGVSCVVTFKATGAPPGNYTNTAIGAGTLLGLVPGVSVTVTPPPGFTKAFESATMPLNGTRKLTFTLTNPTLTTLTNMSFMDDLPLGLIYDSTVSNNCTPVPNGTGGAGTTGTFTPPAASPFRTLTLTGVTLPNAGTCTIVVNVKGIAAGVQNNQAQGKNDLVGINPTASITVVAPAFTKEILPPALSTIPRFDTTTFTITVNNTTAFTLSNLGFTDSVPVGLTLGAITNGCPGGAANVITDAVNNKFTITAFALAPGASCVVTVVATGATVGPYTNTANGTGDLLSLNPSANVTVNPGTVKFSKAFGASPIALLGSTTLTLTIINQTGTTKNAIGFNDPMPAGIVVQGTPTLSGCAPGVIDLPSLPGTIKLTGASLADLGTCTVTATVQGTTAGVNKLNTATGTGDVPGTATATISVDPPAGFSKAFSPTSISLAGSTTLTFTITNPKSITLNNIGFTDNLAAIGLSASNATTPNVCGTGSSLQIASNMITLSAGTLAAGTNCVFSVAVGATTPSLPGPPIVAKHNVATGGGSLIGIDATADLIVTPGPILFSKAFTAPTAVIGTNVGLTFSITNNTGAATAHLNFLDNLPSGMTVVSAPASVCNGGTLLASGTSIQLTDGTLANGSTCSFTVTVVSSTEGPKHNIAVGSSDLNNKTAEADITILGRKFTKAFSPSGITIGFSPVTLTWNITNVNASGTVSAGFNDTLPFEANHPGNPAFQLTVASVNPPSGCGGGAFTPVPVAGATSVTFANAIINAGTTCTVSIVVNVPSVGFYHNIAIGTGQYIGGDQAVADLDVSLPARRSFQLRYFSNLNIGDSLINLTNDGSSSTTGTGTTAQNGNLCVNAYTYSPDEQLISCCSCTVTPNGLNSLSVQHDLVSNPLTPSVPSSVVVKLLATRQNGACNAGAVTRQDLRPGLQAFGATLHQLPTPVGGLAKYAMTETKFHVGELSDAELQRMTQMCALIQANGSGFGICKSCQVGGLGAAAK